MYLPDDGESRATWAACNRPWLVILVLAAVGRTCLHGPLLPKNPALADHLIRLALRRRYGEIPFPPLDDALEAQAREVALHLHC